MIKTNHGLTPIENTTFLLNRLPHPLILQVLLLECDTL